MFRLRRRTAAFATVLLAPGLLLPAAAQNVQRVAAANGPDFSACDKIKSPAASAQCYHDADIAHSKGRIAKADTEADCAEAVAALGRNPRAKALGQTLLNGKRPSEFGVCKFRDALVAAMQ